MAKKGPTIEVTVSHQKGSFPILVEVVQLEEKQTTLIHSLDCNNAYNHHETTLEFQVPPDLGESYLIIYGDLDGKGPSQDDLVGRSDAFTIEQQTIDITVPIQTNKDISPLQYLYASS